MLTRSKIESSKPRILITNVVNQNFDQNSLKSISRVLTIFHWHQAILKAYNVLVKNNAWNLVPISQNAKIIGFKGVHAIKRHPNKTI
ncbi:hypothetical protein AHAS_Ahas11G0251400 [Arachis hypogaea]